MNICNLMSRLAITSYSLIQLFVVLGLIWSFQSQGWFLTQIIASDSLFQAIDVLLRRYQPILTDHFNLLDKYTFYLLLSCVASLFNFLTWSYLTIVWQTLALMLTCPSMLETIFKIAEVQDLVTIFHQKKAELIHWILCLFMSRIINSLAIVNLDTDPQISHGELQQNFQIGHPNEAIWRFIKMFLINTLVKILGQKDKSYTMRILKYLYRRGHIVDIPENHGSFTINNHQLNSHQVLKMVINTRRWHYLYDPRVLDHLIDLYNQGQTNDYWSEIWIHINNELSIRTLRFGTIWTICSFFKNRWFLPIVSLITGSPDFSVWGLSEWSAKIFGYLSLYFWSGFLPSAFISEYFGLIDNSGTRFLLSAIWNRLVGHNLQKPRIISYLTHQNLYNSQIVLASIYLSVVGSLIDNMLIKIFAVGSLSIFSLILVDQQERFVYSWMICWGIFSDYNIFHLIGLAIIIYLVINLMDYQNLPEPLLKINLYNSYYQTRGTTRETFNPDDNLVGSYRNL